MLHRDSLAIISTRGARSGIAPRVWRDLSSITLTHGTTSVTVALARVQDQRGCLTAPRVWFVCPACAALAGAIGFTFDAVGCRACLRWRSREYKVSRKAPHVGGIGVDEA